MVVAGVLAGAAALAMLTGGGAAPAGSTAAGSAPARHAPGRSASGAGAGAHAGVYWQRVQARFAPPTAFIPPSAVTYDMKLVPAASPIEVEQYADPSGTRVTARLAGLKPGHAFGMRVHTRPCGSTPALRARAIGAARTAGNRAPATRCGWISRPTRRARPR